jgi:N-acetylmuramoyl-L-alanine amidase
MSATHRMKRLLCCLLPWMVAAAAIGQEAKPAEVVFTHASPVPALRVGNECFVSPTLFRSLNWPYSLVQSEATIQAEGHVVRVQARTIDDRVYVPLRPILQQIGGNHSAWKKDSDTFEVWTYALHLTARGGRISFESALAVRPVITAMQSPTRLIIDFKGMRLDPRTKLNLDGNARVMQYSPDTVRLTYMTDALPRLPQSPGEPTSKLELSLDGSGRLTEIPRTPEAELRNPPRNQAVAQPPRQGETRPPVQDQNQGQGQNQGQNQNQTQTQGQGQENPGQETPPPTLEITAGPIQALNDGNTGAQFSLRLSRPLTGPPQMRRPDAATVQLVLPGARPLIDEAFKTPSIASQEVSQEGNNGILTIRFARAMGVEMSNTAQEIQLVVVKPAIGDGRLAGKIIVVDAGHGGHDSGAVSPDKKVREKDLTLELAKQVAQELTAQGATVIMTRKTDVFIALAERAAIANRNNAHLFISVHINSNPRPNSTSGGMTFYRGQDRLGKLFAECVQNELAKVTGIPSMGAWSDTRIYQTGFAVLRHSKMPAILIETGFINHSHDRGRMILPKFQSDFGKAVARGVRVFLGDAKPE